MTSKPGVPLTVTATFVAPLVARQFDYVDEAAVSDKLMCAVCLAPLNDPVGFALPCKHYYCRSCITTAIAQAGGRLPCPKCAQPLTIESMRAEHALAGLADEITVFCTNKARGCAWRGERGGVDEHVRVSCNHCPCGHAADGCAWFGLLRHVEAHVTTSCARAPFKVLPDRVSGRTNFMGVCWSGRDLSRTDLSCLNLMNADLSGADLSRANLTGAKLINCDLTSANLSGANLRDAKLTNAVLDITTKLVGADFSGVDLCGRDMSWSDLSGTDLSCAKLSNVNLTGSKLRGAKLPAGFMHSGETHSTSERAHVDTERRLHAIDQQIRSLAEENSQLSNMIREQSSVLSALSARFEPSRQGDSGLSRLGGKPGPWSI